jgi:hypothetical protein
MKTPRELNQEHEARQAAKVRPKQVEYNFAELEAVIRQWKEPK